METLCCVTAPLSTTSCIIFRVIRVIRGSLFSNLQKRSTKFTKHTKREASEKRLFNARLRYPADARSRLHPDSSNHARGLPVDASLAQSSSMDLIPSNARTLPDRVSMFWRSPCRSTDPLHPPSRSSQTCSLRDSQFRLHRETRAATSLHTTSD
jgi:hypothetical protein